MLILASCETSILLARDEVPVQPPHELVPGKTCPVANGMRVAGEMPGMDTRILKDSIPDGLLLHQPHETHRHILLPDHQIDQTNDKLTTDEGRDLRIGNARESNITCVTADHPLLAIGTPVAEPDPVDVVELGTISGSTSAIGMLCFHRTSLTRDFPSCGSGRACMHAQKKCSAHLKRLVHRLTRGDGFHKVSSHIW